MIECAPRPREVHIRPCAGTPIRAGQRLWAACLPVLLVDNIRTNDVVVCAPGQLDHAFSKSSRLGGVTD